MPDTGPVLLSATALADGRVAYLWSVAPGWRVTVISPNGPGVPGVVNLMRTVIIPAIRARKDNLP